MVRSALANVDRSGPLSLAGSVSGISVPGSEDRPADAEQSLLKAGEGRNRVVIEDVSPQIDAGRYAVRRVVGDTVKVTASIFADGHDELGVRMLYRHESECEWRTISMTRGGASPNHDPDEWFALFTVDKVGLWHVEICGWVDRFASWGRDLKKCVSAWNVSSNAENDPLLREIPIRLRTGAILLQAAAQRASGVDEERMLEDARLLNRLAEDEHFIKDYPLSEETENLVARYPDLSFATWLESDLRIEVDRELAGFSSWYELFPRSASAIPGQHGTFADVERQLPEIAEMGFDILYLPPIHPIGRTNRRGKNNSIAERMDDPGSPWAVGDRGAVGTPASSSDAGDCGGHKSIHPQLGDLSSFDHLVLTAQTHGIEIALDIAFQCSPDHPWVTEHQQWFYVRPDGSIQYAENPPKLYQDIFPLNFESEDWRGLWNELYSVFEFWIEHGVRVFRVDNPHTKALPFWRWCLDKLHRRYPDVILLAEAFTRPRVMYQLAKIGFTQSYTYFTWRNTKQELQSYFEEINRPPLSEFFRPNCWPSTPDILPVALQQGGPSAFRQRLILAATLSSNYGIYGPAFELCENNATKPSPGKNESEEYLDSEKYQIRQRDRNAEGSLVPLIRSLNQIRRGNRSLQANQSLHFHNVDSEELICYSKTTRDFDNTILILVNLDTSKSQSGWIDLDLDHLGIESDADFVVKDLLTAESETWHGSRNAVTLRCEGEPVKIFLIGRPALSIGKHPSASRALPESLPPRIWREEE